MVVKFSLLFNPWSSNSASSNRLLSLIYGLRDEGVEVYIIIYGPFKSEIEKNEWPKQGEYNGVCYKYLNTICVTGYFKTRFYNYVGKYVFQREVINKFKEELSDDTILWLDGTEFSFNRAITTKKAKPNKQLFIEMSEFLDIHQYNKGNFLQRYIADRRQRLFEKQVFPILDGLALMTKTLFTHYKSFPEPQPKMLHLPMTVDLDRFDQIGPSLPEFKKPYIAFVGVMNDAKDGVDILLKSFAEIAEEFATYKLYLVGGWNYDTPSHLKFIKEKQLDNRIFWMKQYPRDSIPTIIGNADLLVLPRPDSKQAQGGFPTKLGEYLATGNPVCATSVGEIPDYLSDNESVFFAQPGSVEAFAQAMKRALIDPENAQRVGLKGREIAQKEFNKDIQAKKLHQFLLDLQKKQND